ncbi:hypothetical protein H2248_004361 [Termitomyces sp. 'cryptogamus']|nr:hypothetical protein H2248_004361 [Termitomyces sp. 'cryptogamus']
MDNNIVFLQSSKDNSSHYYVVGSYGSIKKNAKVDSVHEVSRGKKSMLVLGTLNKKNGVKKFLIKDGQKSQSIVQPLEGSNVVASEEHQIDAAISNVSSFWNNDEGLKEISQVSKEV